MTDTLSSAVLLDHVRVLAEEIGPRPTGHPQEAQARAYIRAVLEQAGLTEIEEMPLEVWDTWGYALIAPALLALLGNGRGRWGRFGKLAGGLVSLFGAYHLWKAEAAGRQPLGFLFPKKPTANLIVRIPAQAERRNTVVLVGHTDTNKHRFTFSPEVKRLLLPTATAAEAAMLVNGGAQLAQAAGGGKAAETLRRVSQAGLSLALPYLLNDELGEYIPGAADNASAVACLLGLGAHLKVEPLAHTEVWLAFTAAEEVGCLGMHALLDAYGNQLADAWFLDFEMVSTPEIVYITRHSSLSYLSGYTPDPESLAWADETARRHPELGVSGREMVIVEEVGTLRGRGFRGICLAGVGDDGWLSNWHRSTDDLAHLDPAGLERAARFALAMLQTLDAHSRQT
jgi:hypothetical protein